MRRIRVLVLASVVMLAATMSARAADKLVNRIHMAMGPGQGYAPENVLHTGPGPIRKGIWTGFNWSAGGALAASAYLERTFGSAWTALPGRSSRLTASAPASRHGPRIASSLR